MAGFLDFVFGKSALNKAAQTGGTPAATTPAAPAGIDIAAMAQKAADAAKATKALSGIPDSHKQVRNPDSHVQKLNQE